MIRRPLLLAALGLAVLAPAAAAAEHVPGEVVVRYADDAALPGTAHASAVVAPRTRVVRTRPGQTVDERAAELRRRPGVLSATPNYIARASYIPNDPGRARRARRLAAAPVELRRPVRRQRPGRLGPHRRGRPPRRRRRRRRGARHRRRVRRPRPLRALAGPARQPLRARLRLRRRRPLPDDENGHGTHVASTIAESDRQRRRRHRPRLRRADHAGARARPLRARATARRSRRASASRRASGADIINLSFEFGAGVTRAGRSPTSSTRCASRAARASLVVGASGNVRARVGRLPGARRRRALGRRHDRARLPRRLLQQGPHARPRRPGRRARRGARGRPELPPLRARGPRASCR